MVHYSEVDATFSEVPKEVSLTISVNGCGNRCKGCHSPHLQENKGKVLDIDTLNDLLEEYSEHVSVVTFLGGDNNPSLVELLEFIKTEYSGLKICIYTGNNTIPDEMMDYLDYYKIGSYIEELGGLSSVLTNQRMYKLVDGEPIDITHMFRRVYG